MPVATTATATVIKTITMTALPKIIISAALAAAVGIAIYQAHQKTTLRDENNSLQQEIAQLRTESESLSNRLAAATVAKAPPDGQYTELLRLRGEVGVLRRQTNELGQLLARQRSAPPAGANPVPDRPTAPVLPDDYPKTPDGATKGIFDAWARGDWDAFFTNFGEPGVSRDMYDKMFAPMTNLLAGMKVVSMGEPTNSFGPNMWFVPYTVQFSDGSQKTMRLHVAQDPTTQRWMWKGGF